MKKMHNVFLLFITAIFVTSSIQARELDEPADLSVSLTSPMTTVTNGAWATFYVTAKNNGPHPIYAIDSCEIQCSPAPGQYGDDGNGGTDPSDAVVSGPGSINKSNWDIVWFPGAIAPGQSVVMTIQIPVNIGGMETLQTATATGHYSNSDVCDTNWSNNSDSLLLNYQPAMDLSIAMDDGGNDSWDLGSGHYELSLTALNDGPSIASGATVDITLPLGCTYSVEWPDDPADFSLQGNLLTWNLSDHNEEGSTVLWPSVSANMILHITPTNAGEKVVSCVLNHPYDTDASNNTAVNSMPVVGSGDGSGGSGTVTSLQLMGWDVVPTVERYGNIEHVLRVKNNGPDALNNVTITNLMDSRCLFDSATTPQGSFSEHNGLVVFDLGTVASGADLYLNLEVIPLESGVMTNDARIYMDVTGNEYGDSAVIEETTVNPGPYVLTATPMDSTTAVYGFRVFNAVVTTNGQEVAGVVLDAEVIRGPHMGMATNVTTQAGVSNAPASALFVLEDDLGYPGIDYISVTGQVGKIPFALDLKAEWAPMESQTYTCTNLGFITESEMAIFEINVPDGFEIADIKTSLHFEHSYPSDLEFRLYSPHDFGQPVIETYLIEQLPAFMVDDLEVGRSGAYCTLDESAATSISNAVAPFSGSYTSQFRELTSYIGAESEGTWVLMIEDMNLDPEDFDYGELLGWTLTLEPNDGDLDNDGMNDLWETNNGLDPTDPSDATADSDGDGSSNYTEFRTRKNPQSPTDSFAMTQALPSGDDFVITWSSTPNQFYTILWSTNLLHGCTNVLDSGIFATPPENEYTVTNSALKSAFFTVEQEY